MTGITIIAAIGRNRVIGVDNDLPWRLPGDLPRLKRLTMGHVLVMGRKTYDSIGRPLPGRTTIVVTRQRNWTVEGVTVVHSVEEALEVARTVATGEVFIFGGGEIYRAALPYVDTMLITEVDQEPNGDVLFPAYDEKEWREISREPHDGFTYVTYVRTNDSQSRTLSVT